MAVWRGFGRQLPGDVALHGDRARLMQLFVRPRGALGQMGEGRCRRT
jgi:hypothetical protein